MSYQQSSDFFKSCKRHHTRSILDQST